MSACMRKTIRAMIVNEARCNTDHGSFEQFGQEDKLEPDGYFAPDARFGSFEQRFELVKHGAELVELDAFFFCDIELTLDVIEDALQDVVDELAHGRIERRSGEDRFPLLHGLMQRMYHLLHSPFARSVSNVVVSIQKVISFVQAVHQVVPVGFLSTSDQHCEIY